MRNFTFLLTAILGLFIFTSCEVTVIEQSPNVQVHSISKIDRTYYETNIWGNQTEYSTTDYELVIENNGYSTARRVEVNLIVEDVDGWIHETEILIDYLHANYQESFVIETGLSPEQIYGHDVRVSWSN